LGVAGFQTNLEALTESSGSSTCAIKRLLVRGTDSFAARLWRSKSSLEERIVLLMWIVSWVWWVVDLRLSGAGNMLVEDELLVLVLVLVGRVVG
jgi:hypothetical protein